MNYRPQFAVSPCPAGFHDEEFIHYFDELSNPALGLTLAGGATLRDIPLQLETDAVFIARGVRLGSIATVNVQLREPGGRLLSPEVSGSGFLIPYQSYLPGGLDLTPAGGFELMTVPLEPEIECPAGSVFMAYFQNATSPPAPVAIDAVIAIFGVKRYADCKR